MPKVSICIPTYKQTQHLKKALDSVITQDFRDYEIIISDDTQDDSVKNLLQSYQFNNAMYYFQNIPALGSPENWNFAISKANSEYIKILHHDDYFTSKNSLGKFVALLDNNPQADFAFSGSEVEMLEQNKIIKSHCSKQAFQLISQKPSELLITNHIGAPSSTIVRKANVIEFDKNMKWLVDVDWYIQLLNINNKIVSTNEYLVCFLLGAQGQVTQSVINDKVIQIREHVYLFIKVFETAFDKKKYNLFFQILFSKHQINSFEDLNTIIETPLKMKSFFESVFERKDHFIWFKKVYYWLNKYKLKYANF
jgi:glycosyltransferase involved in cell wall biosynthesis